jgi:hypothetical protein
MNAIRKSLVASGLFLLLAGCTTYYEVTDPTTGKAYYTTSIDTNSSGSSTFTDARTGDKMTLQNSQVATITQQQYDNGKNGAAPAKQP